MRIGSSVFKGARFISTKSEEEILSKDAKSDKVSVRVSSREREEELSRLMDTYSEMTNPWVLSTLRLPMFPYWRDVAIRSPSIDVVDYGDGFTVTAELPGFDKDEVEVTVNGFSLEIKAEKDLVEKGKTKNYIQRERLHSSFRRLIQFPQEVTSSKAKAVLGNGLLEVDVPKIEPTNKRSRKIEIQ